jgi:hypothetical protein
MSCVNIPGGVGGGDAGGGGGDLQVFFFFVFVEVWPSLYPYPTLLKKMWAYSDESSKIVKHQKYQPYIILHLNVSCVLLRFLPKPTAGVVLWLSFASH